MTKMTSSDDPMLGLTGDDRDRLREVQPGDALVRGGVLKVSVNQDAAAEAADEDWTEAEKADGKDFAEALAHGRSTWGDGERACRAAMFLRKLWGIPGAEEGATVTARET